MKKVFIGMLAALMLFAFTACEQQGYKIPTGLTATTTKTSYVVGSSIDVSTITGTLEYSDGSTRTVAGTDLMVNADLTTAGTKPVSVSYGSVQGQLGATLYVNVYEVTAITGLEFAELPAVVDVASGTVTVDAVATLSNEATDNVKAVIAYSGAPAADADAAVPTVSKITVNSDSTDIKSVAVGLDDWKVNVKADTTTFDPTNVTSLEVTYNPASGSNGQFYVDDVVTYTVNAVDGNGNKATITTSDNANGKYAVLNGASLPANFTLKETAGETTYTIYYVGNPTVTATIRAPQGVPYVQTVTLAKKADAPELSAAGGTLTVGQIATYYDISLTKHGDSATFTPSVENCVITNATWAENAGPGTTTFAPSIMVKVGKGDGTWTSISSVPVLTVAAPAEA